MKFTLGRDKGYTALATTELSTTGILKTESINNISMSSKVFNRFGVAVAVLQTVSSLPDLITK